MMERIRFHPHIKNLVIEQFENQRLCASCGWVWLYSDLGYGCPRCSFSSYSLSDGKFDDEEIRYYVSLEFWKERTHLPDAIADWIIDVHRQSKALESL